MLKKSFVFFVVAFLLLFSLGVTPSSAAENKFLIINKATNQLAYYDGGKLVKVFKVATGRSPSYTPEGRFKIVTKIVNRPYYKGGIPGGDPRNPLGNRWLGLNARGTWGTTYAIHGNNNPSSIGKYVSSGCIRMYDEEVEWLYDHIPLNTTVIITTSGKSFDAIAAANGLGTATPVSGSSEVLKQGSRGTAVKELQQKLTSLGYNTKGIDGIFGPNTTHAVRQFQATHGLSADGIVNSATQKALDSAKGGSTPPSTGSALNNSGILRKGSRGAAVTELQQKLTSLGFDTRGVDGIFGSNTDQAVRKFQAAHGLAVDGIVGLATKQALMSK
ncbi:peptidoglycan-binding protein [Bacillus sp. 165]|uniref:L,D-transpeptidase family protein n=1 Tax=Bacillus sp. 165 TaxID=1529117 RepID=UPI001AD9F81E|nr:peptidoglycan-binding protein [Bacillus sp. 165]MBO9128380.1 peptidoglycan-binding protein [Bacillus sp. 165]